MDENIVKSLQTTAQPNNSNQNITDEEQQHPRSDPSETDILYKYQQRHERRMKNGSNAKKPTKRGYGEPNTSFPKTANANPTCLNESFYILFTWFGYSIHVACALLSYKWFGGKISINDFYAHYSIDIAPANWNVVQFGIQLLWQGILLTYLSLIIAEHTIKIFPKGFYFGLGTANILLAIWDICTEHKSYLGRTLSWLGIAICLFYVNYILLKHIYFIFDVTKYIPPSRFRLDSLPSDHTVTLKNAIYANGLINSGNTNQKTSSDDLPPLTISTNMEKSKTNTKNINAILRIQSGGSINNSPVSMSMAPSAAQKLVYDAAEAANVTTDDWLITKTTDLTRLKYSGLVGIVFNGLSYYLSIICVNWWVQVGVWLKYECGVKDDIASIVSLIMIFLCIIVYYYFDFIHFRKYFVDNFATHIVFCITFAAMVYKHIFGDGNEETNRKNYSKFSVVFQTIIFCIVVIVAIFKVIFAMRIHREYKNGTVNESIDQYKRVI